MKTSLIAMVVALALAWPFAGLCQDTEQPVQREGYGRGWQQGSGMGYGRGPGYMRDYSYAMPPDYSMPGPLQSLKPEDRKKWEKMYASYLMEIMGTRKKIAVTRIELETLWAQPDLDRAKVEKLSAELSELYTQRMKACDKYVIKARASFGKLGWACPVGVW